MPWQVYKDGEQWCVHKLNDDGSKGEQVACHATEDMAKRQQAALYANEPQTRAAKQYTAAQREAATTMPDGSFPIDNVADLRRAIAAAGRGNPPPSPARLAAIKRWIIRRARALGAVEVLPEQWRSLSTLFDEDQREFRSVSAMDAELSADGNTFTGYASVFDVVAHIDDDITESVSRGAFRKVLATQRDNVPFLYNHGRMTGASGIPMATTAAGTLRLGEDTKGLHVEADLPQHHPEVRMLREQIDRGEVGGMSWGFVIGDRKNARVELRGASLHRELLGFKKILDVSPTWEPTYAETDVEIRSMRYNSIRDFLGLEQQLFEGDVPQLEDGALDQPDGEEQDKQDHIELRSGAASDNEAAARTRQLLAEMEAELVKDKIREAGLDLVERPAIWTP